MERTFEQKTYQAIENLKLLQAYTSATEPTVQVQTITDLTSKTQFGNWLAWAYMDNREQLPADKWTQLLQIAMNLMLFFTKNFVSGNTIHRPRIIKIGLWLRFAYKFFDAIVDVVKILRK